MNQEAAAPDQGQTTKREQDLERKLALAKENRALQSVGLAPTNVGDLNTLANMLARSEIIPAKLRGKPADIAIILMWAGELRIGGAQAMSAIDVIEGSPSLSAELMRGLVQRHPDCEYFEPIETTNEKAVYATRRKGRDREITMTYTIEDARRAKLDHKANWQKDPMAMLSARATSRLARAAWADVCMGLILDDEAAEIHGDRPAMTAPVAPPPAAPVPEKDELAEVLGEGDTKEADFEEVPPEAEPGKPDLSLEDKLHMVTTMDQLKSLRPEIEALPEGEQAVARAIYSSKSFEIQNPEGK